MHPRRQDTKLRPSGSGHMPYEPYVAYDRLSNGSTIIPSWKINESLPGMDDEVFADYRQVMFLRHRIWQHRQSDIPEPPRTPLYPILEKKKFTNVFRVLDPGSQYVVRMLQEPGLEPEDALARAILYRFTNRPETWDHLKNVYGRWPLAEDMNGDLVQALHETPGGQIFSGAYIIMPTPGKEGDKVLGAVRLTRRLTARGGSERVVEQVAGAASPAAAYAALRGHFGMGDFMSMQILTDWGYYWPEYDENEFVVAGPGSRRGVAELFPNGTDLSAEEVIRWVRDDWWLDVSCPAIPMPGGQLRVPSLMDVQNTFCEYSKYRRYKRNGDISGPLYRQAHPGKQPLPLLPHHWTAGSR